MSQKELADLLQVRASFLSAIENGKSRLPEEKLEKIKEIFELDSLEDYLVDDETEVVVPPHTHASDTTDTIAQLLNHFHALAHKGMGYCWIRGCDVVRQQCLLVQRYIGVHTDRQH